MRNWWVMLICSLAVWSEPALAGPGGKIARVMFETPWGKVVLVLLTLIFLPLIIYMQVKEWRAGRRARADLRFMARYSPLFDWLRLTERIRECFLRVHGAWSDEEVGQLAACMTDWYRQNQQRQLDAWRAAGLVNICEVKTLSAIKPLLFVHRNHADGHEGSSLVVSLTAKMQDYLAERASGKVVEGSKNFKDVKTIWTFVLSEGSWRVNSIEEGSLSIDYAKLVRELPPIESTVGERVRL